MNEVSLGTSGTNVRGGTYRQTGSRLRRVQPNHEEHLLVLLHGGEDLRTEIVAVLVVALLVVLALRGLRFVRLFGLLLAALLLAVRSGVAVVVHGHDLGGKELLEIVIYELEDSRQLEMWQILDSEFLKEHWKIQNRICERFRGEFAGNFERESV